MVMTKTGRDSIHNAPKKRYQTDNDSDEDACRQIPDPSKKPGSSKETKKKNKGEGTKKTRGESSRKKPMKKKEKQGKKTMWSF
ncbi:hypothetical protein LIER_43494 [Lithospermum erythrorhizon]|uniref:Uncharacterized protein n=1 Tax=Lithospermum erythrorhizon TaxID=34254 RepID=A0AAV3Q8D3_LITER